MQVTIEYYRFSSGIFGWSEIVVLPEPFDPKQAVAKVNLSREDCQKYFYKFKNDQGQYYNFTDEQWE